MEDKTMVRHELEALEITPVANGYLVRPTIDRIGRETGFIGSLPVGWHVFETEESLAAFIKEYYEKGRIAQEEMLAKKEPKPEKS